MEINEQHKRQFLSEMELMGLKEALLGGYYDVLAAGKQVRVSWQEYDDIGNTRILYEPELRLDAFSLPYLYGYTATLLETHPIHHGIYEQIDTEQLEGQLKEGKWLTDAVLFSQLYARITELSVCGNSSAKDIAQRLEARYWLGTTVDRCVNGDLLRKKFGRKHFFHCGQQGVSNVSLLQAYNLMSGRPVLRFEETKPTVYTGYWFGLKRFQKPLISMDRELVWFEEKRYPGFVPHLLLRNLPIKDIEQEGSEMLLVQQLVNGGFAHTVIKIAGEKRSCQICADAENNRLRLFNAKSQEFSLLISSPEKKIEQPLNKKKKPPPFKRTKGNRI